MPSQVRRPLTSFARMETDRETERDEGGSVYAQLRAWDGYKSRLFAMLATVAENPMGSELGNDLLPIYRCSTNWSYFR